MAINSSTQNYEDDDKQGGASSQTGSVTKPMDKHWDRDDFKIQPLSAAEEHLLSVHKTRQATHVEQTKREMVERTQRIEQEATKSLNHGATGGMSQGAVGKVKEHPLLGKKAHAIDSKVSHMPNDNEAKTNPELRNELQNKHELSLDHQPQPKSTPQPRPY